MSTQTEARAGIAVANAPVSYGAFEITVGHDPNVPDGISVLDQVAAAGYAGIDLGPVGYLGSGTRLGELLAERGLGLAGGYLELPYADHDALQQALGELDALLATFDAVLPYLPGPPPRPTLADAGSPQRRNLRRPDQSALLKHQAGLADRVNGNAAFRLGDRYRPEFHGLDSLGPLGSRGGFAPARSRAVISPMIATAISGGDTAEMSKPIGA